VASKKTQFVLLPSAGMQVSDVDTHQMQLFKSLHSATSAAKATHTVLTEAKSVAITVIDSIGENKAKLIEVAAEDLAAFRGVHPSVRVMPVVYYQRAVVRYQALVPPARTTSRSSAKNAADMTRNAAKARSAAGALMLIVSSAKGGRPVAGAMVVAFTDFAGRVGAQGTTNARGEVALSLGAATKKLERVYVYPKAGYWPIQQSNVTLKSGGKIELPPINNAYVDCVRFFYAGGDLNSGKGVTVGVIDSGIATTHPDLTVQGGQNTVPGENPQDFGDNGTEGHGTHVAGIIAAHGVAPGGVGGVAPGVTLRSYRVFGQGGNNASNYSIAKALDAAAADKCDLVNMSLGGGDPDPVTTDAIAAAYRAGVVIFAANGNDDRQAVSYPAANAMCQAVSAMGRKGTFPNGTEPVGSVAAPYGRDRKNFVASFSNVGPETDLTGPGVGVISTVPTGYGVMSGTSMATPAETGAAARLLAGKSTILAMPRDQHRAATMIAALAQACKLLGFGASFEGKGMISL
jgi:subtilisin